MKAIQFGAGNIGRGFIGELLSLAGYEVVFADIVDGLLDLINRKGQYVVHIADVNSSDVVISNVQGVRSDGKDIVREIIDADLITTAVGLRVLRFVAPSLSAGLKARREAGVEKPLNIIACENGIRASSQLRALLELDPDTEAWLGTHTGFPDCAVDRIVPPVRCPEPLDVAVEEYCEWDVERQAFVGSVPKINGMTPVDNLEAFIERKLFTLNTGHAVAAYLGLLHGHSTIGEAMDDPAVLSVVKAAMCESGDALIRKFGFDHDAHYAYIAKVLSRFTNPYLRDDCVRVGRQPLRKLSRDDRIVMPILNARSFGLPYKHLLLAAGAALHFSSIDDPESLTLQKMIREKGSREAIPLITGLDPSDPLVNEIDEAYTLAASIS